MVSCVTKNLPHYPHPHSIVGTDRPAEKKSFKHGVCTVEFQNPEMKCSLSNLGIQCVKKKEIPQALEQRKRIKVDPFNCNSDGLLFSETLDDLNKMSFYFRWW